MEGWQESNGKEERRRKGRKSKRRPISALIIHVGSLSLRAVGAESFHIPFQ